MHHTVLWDAPVSVEGASSETHSLLGCSRQGVDSREEGGDVAPPPWARETHLNGMSSAELPLGEGMDVLEGIQQEARA